ncbi:MAG: flagellar biosynthetic protein FliR [Rhodoblastus sp.]
MTGFVIFCRIGMCLSFAPGLSSPRIPMRARLLVAIGLTVALSPMLLQTLEPRPKDFTAIRLFALVVQESAIGATIGIMARLVFSSLEMMFTAAAMAIGASSSFAPRVDDGENMPEFAAIIVFAITTLLFVTNLHWEILRAVLDSYAAMPLGRPIAPQFALSAIGDTLSFGLSAAFRLAGPFLVFGLVANFAFALVNKITPQIAIYFVSTPFILFGGLVLLHILWSDLAVKFLNDFRLWLERM